MRTFVTTKVPRWPRSSLRFHTPWNLLRICSSSRSASSLLSTTAERILTSRYGRVMSYARLTACTDVKSRGESLTRFVKINSKRLPLKRVNMYSALVCPRSLLVAVLMLIERKIAKPIERLHFLFRSDCHIMRRLVIVSVPLSPLLPLVSSTCRSLSMTNSPLRSSRRCAGLSNLISRSCHSSCGACIVVCPPRMRTHSPVHALSSQQNHLALGALVKSKPSSSLPLKGY